MTLDAVQSTEDLMFDYQRDVWEPAQLDPEITWDGAWAELTPRQREIREIAREVAVTELRPRAHLWTSRRRSRGRRSKQCSRPA